MAKSDDDVDLTDEQASEVMKLRNEHQSAIGFRVENADVWFGCHVCNYLASLCLEAAARKQPRLRRRAAAGRRDSLTAFQSYLERPAQAEDVINELAKTVTVPGYLLEVVREDFASLRA
jgi:hypothetical protein